MFLSACRLTMGEEGQGNAMKKLTGRARELRKNMTPEEKKLWYQFLRGYPIHIYRQRVLGNYIVDFFCLRANLAIELDGSQHYQPAQIEYDRIRAWRLEAIGVQVLRFTNREVRENFPGVCQAIHNAIQSRI